MITLRSPRQTRQDDIVPMINVAFLLLVFFLMSAVIAPPAPVDIAAPSTTEASGGVDGVTLFVTSGGELIGADGLVVQDLGEFTGGPVTVSAGATFPANLFVRIVGDLRNSGVTEIYLITQHEPN